MRNKDGLNTLQWIGFVAVLAGMMCFGTGCAGMEVGGRLGIYRVDQREESQKTYANTKPAICYLFPSRCLEEK